MGDTDADGGDIVGLHDQLCSIADGIGPALERHYQRLIDDTKWIPTDELCQRIADSEQAAINAYLQALMDQVQFAVMDHLHQLTGDAVAARDLCSKLKSECTLPSVDRLEISHAVFTQVQDCGYRNRGFPLYDSGGSIHVNAERVCYCSESTRQACSDGARHACNRRPILERLRNLFKSSKNCAEREPDASNRDTRCADPRMRGDKGYSRVAMDESTLNPAAVREDLLRKEVQRVLRTRRHDMERRFKDMVLKYETRVKSISVGSGGSHGVE